MRTPDEIREHAEQIETRNAEGDPVNEQYAIACVVRALADVAERLDVIAARLIPSPAAELVSVHNPTPEMIERATGAVCWANDIAEAGVAVLEHFQFRRGEGGVEWYTPRNDATAVLGRLQRAIAEPAPRPFAAPVECSKHGEPLVCERCSWIKRNGFDPVLGAKS